MRASAALVLAVVAAAVAAGGCSTGDESAQSVQTVTVEREVTVEKRPSPRKKKEPNPFPEQAPRSTAGSEFVNCDSNIQAKAGTTTCPFAQNTFWSYWTSREAPSLRVWSPATHTTFTTSCDSDGSQVTCTTSDGGAVSFPEAALDSYSEDQADAYASSHDLGPDPYEGLDLAASPPDSPPDEPDSYYPPEESDGYTAPGENIPNYENGRGYRVQCADGTYSQSGGIQGACSHHGGVAD